MENKSKISKETQNGLLEIGHEAYVLYHEKLSSIVKKAHNNGELSDQEEAVLEAMREKLEDVSMMLSGLGFFYTMDLSEATYRNQEWRYVE